jgi:Uma2 family endonuclease
MVMPLPVPLLTIEMLDDFPDDGTRYELLEGMLLVTPAPSHAHQVVVTRLVLALARQLEPDGAAQVVAVGAIQRGKHTQLQPDILIYPSAYPPRRRRVLDRGSRRLLRRSLVARHFGDA